MVQKTINFTEYDDLQITSHLNMEALPQLLQDLLSMARTTEQKPLANAHGTGRNALGHPLRRTRESRPNHPVITRR